MIETDLPIGAVLSDVHAALDGHGAAVLVAPPGTGKTTIVPLSLAERDSGRIVVAEPRRLATRAAALRMAALLGEDVGGTVGYSVRGERKVSARTRIEVVTSGLLVRRVQADPELPGVSTVLIDECHERHLDADLLLALLVDVRGGLREDLRLLATSATVAADTLATLLGDAPVVTANATTYPVTVEHIAPARHERIEATVARAVGKALATTEGDVLAFLPGAGEIARARRVLDNLGEVDVLTLHGKLAASGQDAALTPGPRRRVVLATAIAESSLTVPGVRAVVDAGLARVPRVDHRRGLPGLATVRVSAAVAEQRAGRAGRQGPGTVFRCWPAHEQASLPPYPEPEIRTAELSSLALELACWSTPDGSGLAWWDRPPEGALAAGRALLRTLEATAPDGTVTRRGRRMAALGLHPRLARALLDGASEVGARAAAEVVALLDGGASGVDVEDELRRLRRSADGKRWRRDVDRLASLVPDGDGTPDPAFVVALAHPERLARRRKGGAPVYLLASGTAAELRDAGGLADAEWLAVAEATREPGRAHAVIRLAARADEKLARTVAAAQLTETEEVTWADGDVLARKIQRLGAITLAETPLPDPDSAAVRAALLTGIRKEGLGLLRWTDDATRLAHRLAFLHERLGQPWPDVSEQALLSEVDVWLAAELSTATGRADLGRIAVEPALRGLLSWREAARLDELAPDRLTVPSGSRIRVDYSSGSPVLAVKLQETFGWLTTPKVAGGTVPVVLHLLSPAGRPAAVTSDLASFWKQGYLAVRAELRGRYPKHPWPEDPMTAPPARGTRRRT
ncbi:ATP-dependent helicase HrpB [Prauserella marina]|nr:ATP-dependent helicase HrpB [Prauserella marina]ASR38969.1 ATP-dependent helicase HrpB [Prauserella marina]